jgi:hypothetical protein
MMEWIDRHCRFFHRLVTRGCVPFLGLAGEDGREIDSLSVQADATAGGDPTSDP